MSLNDELADFIDPILAAFQNNLEMIVQGHAVKGYLVGSAQMVSWGRTKKGLKKLYEGPPIQEAIEFANKHCAKLVTRMNAETKERLAKVIGDGIENKRGIPGLARDIRKEFDDMTKYRSELISRTETCDSLEQAFMDRSKAMGITGKEWITHDPCPICATNEAEGMVPIDHVFSSGHERPPAHPNCVCALAPAMLAVNESIREGGQGSGNFGHSGRPGEIGGSGEGGGGVSTYANRINNIGFMGSESDARDFRDELDANAETDENLRNLLDASDRWVAEEDWVSVRNEADAYLKGGDCPDDTKSLLQAVSGSQAESPKLYRGISIDDSADSVMEQYSKGKEFDISLSSFTSDESIADGYAKAWNKQTQVTFEMPQGCRAFYVAPTQPDFLENQEWITGGRFQILDVGREGKHNVRIILKQTATHQLRESLARIKFQGNLELNKYFGGLAPKGKLIQRKFKDMEVRYAVSDFR